MKKPLPLILLFVVLAGGIYFLFFYAGSDPETTENTETPPPGPLVQGDSADAPGEEPTKLELERQQQLNEHARPDDYLQLAFDYRRNILGETVIEGTMTNNAEMTTYRDIQLMVWFDDAEGYALDSASQLVFETVRPSEKTDFRMKRRGPKGTKALRVQVKNAKVVEEE